MKPKTGLKTIVKHLSTWSLNLYYCAIKLQCKTSNQFNCWSHNHCEKTRSQCWQARPVFYWYSSQCKSRFNNWDLRMIFMTNLALQGYSRAHSRSGRWLVGFRWGVVVGYGENTHPTKPHPTQPKTYSRAHLLGQNIGPCYAWFIHDPLLSVEPRFVTSRRFFTKKAECNTRHQYH